MTIFQYLKSPINKYINKQFLLWFFICSIALMVIICFFEGIEILRKAMNRPDISLLVILRLALLRIPSHLFEFMPFIVFLSALLSLWRLNHFHEILAIRACGVSADKIALGLAVLCLFIGLINLLVLNPISSAMNSYYVSLEAKHFKNKQVQNLSISSTGLWVKENHSGKHNIFHATTFDLPLKKFYDVTFYEYAEDGTFEKQIDAKEAELNEKFWRLNDVKILSKDNTKIKLPNLEKPADLTLSQIEKNANQPNQILFWQIPNVIKELKKRGMSSKAFEIYWHRLLADVFLLAVMACLAVGFCIPNPRFHATAKLIGLALLSGFLIHFLNNIIHALGYAERIPILLSAWIPPFITGFFAVSYLMHVDETA